MPSRDSAAGDSDKEHRPKRHDTSGSQLGIPTLKGGNLELGYFRLDQSSQRGAQQPQDHRQRSDPKPHIDDGLGHPPDREYGARITENANSNGPEEKARHDFRLGTLEARQSRVKVGHDARSTGQRVKKFV